MAKVGFYKRYLYIVDRLKSVPSNFQDLHKYVMTKLENDDLGNNFEYSVRTFDRDKKDIFDEKIHLYTPFDDFFCFICM